MSVPLLIFLLTIVIILAIVLIFERDNIHVILKPNLLKVIICFVILFLLHFYFISTVKISYISPCYPDMNEECKNQESQRLTIIKHRNALSVDLIVGLPIVLLIYVFIGVYQSKKYNEPNS
ncbi:MAG: hypothetical protein US31_C0001G0059 [Berkelbacteria bacterium GW2011_GWA1_36_9]|uniref:Uncharacterized protein n=1 Tax=Berkelbacteria bacterium GW2011_GWA1_36_9 TaxID=1618331 RepID=A0A0G0FM30_9BACT|nr:MAG: hypothetical protein US31_C0001G0059 [Berkelbacteria bacterium GW2011_GWA1_36_9]